MPIRKLILASAAITALAACGNKTEEAETKDAEVKEAETTVPSVEDVEKAAKEKAAAVAMEALKKSEAFLAENAKVDGIKVTESGLQFLSMVDGEGAVPTEKDYVTVHYTGTKLDGSVFDSSVERNEEVTFPLGQVIEGWKEGLLLMKEGGKAKFTLPPDLAYGETGTGDGAIGPNEAITFEVELIEVIAADNTARLQEVQQAAIKRYADKMQAIADANEAKATAFLEGNTGQEGVMVTDSGLQYKVLEQGAGTVSPISSDTVEVHYRGTLIDGTEFDSSYNRGQTTTFPLANVIVGWTEGLQLMKEGDKFQFFIPPALAYGPGGKGPIGPNELLIFEVELVDVKGKETPAEAAE